jgi:hypothetical protein
MHRRPLLAAIRIGYKNSEIDIASGLRTAKSQPAGGGIPASELAATSGRYNRATSTSPTSTTSSSLFSLQLSLSQVLIVLYI